jgi:Dam-replacing family
LSAIREDRTPNLFLLRYALATWEVRDLLLIPSFLFSESAVIKRKPLSSTARRASVNRAKRQHRRGGRHTRRSGQSQTENPEG